MPATVLWRKARKCWVVRARFDGSEKLYTVGTGDEDQAKAQSLADRLNLEYERRRVGGLGFDPRGPLLIGDLFASLLVAYSWRYSDGERKNIESRLRKHLLPAFGDQDLRSLVMSDVNQFVSDKLEDGLAPPSVASCLSTLRRLVNVAVADKLLKDSPVPQLSKVIKDLEKRSRKTIEAWTHEERDTILDLARKHEPRLYLPVHIAFYTGARRGEVLGLFWKHIDFARSRIHIEQQINRGKLKPPKWNSLRFVPLHASLAALLRQEAKRLRLVAPWDDPDFIVKSPEGKAWDGDNFSRVWRRLMRCAVAQGVRPFGFHATRHTFASHAIEGGKSAKWVAERMGHRSTAFTFDQYGHMLPDRENDLGFLDGVGSANRSRLVSSPSSPAPRDRA